MQIDKKITLFRNFSEPKKPYYSTVNAVLNRIKDCKIEKQILAIRAETDSKKRTELKRKLPCILWSGEFSERLDKSIISHSGFCILDFDHIEKLEELKQSMANYPFVYAAFVSPSGDGLKVLVRIPESIEGHRGHYRALTKVFEGLDVTSVNESRICYESIDSDIYINTGATVFTDWIEDFQKAAPLGNKFSVNSFNDYGKANTALLMIRNAIDGEKHQTLIKSARLMGGFVSGGIINELEAIRLLEQEISLKNIDDFPAAKIAIKKAIEYGKSNPIEKVEYQKNIVESKIIIDNEDYSFLATNEDCDIYLNQKINGTFQMGNTTGFPELDKYYRFKDSQLDMVLGHDNAGKSTVSWYFAVLDAHFNDKNYIIYSGENKTGGVKVKLMEFYLCKNIEKMNSTEIAHSKAWVENHFALIKNDDVFSYSDMITIGKKMLKKKKYHKFIIEPYNVLDKKTTNEHQYDYRAMLELRMFIRQTEIGVLLNVHASTEALRKTYPKEHDYFGYTIPPNKADTEGGGKFPNKADNFIVVHRMADHPTEWVWTEIHIQKIKESETGGKRTFKNEPFKIRMVAGGCGFEDVNGFNPMETRNSENKQLKVNTEFLNEKISDYNGDNPF